MTKVKSSHVLPEVKILTSKIYKDTRGVFEETYSRNSYAELGIKDDFVQDNYSLSQFRSTVRGLHFQAPPYSQAKIVRCGKGAIFDVVVDIRRDSETYGTWVGYELTADNAMQVYIPKGFAHGFISLQPNSETFYKCSNYYHPAAEVTLAWNDSDLGIVWPDAEGAIVSEKDQRGVLFKNFKSPYRYGVNS